MPLTSANAFPIHVMSPPRRAVDSFPFVYYLCFTFEELYPDLGAQRNYHAIFVLIYSFLSSGYTY